MKVILITTSVPELLMFPFLAYCFLEVRLNSENFCFLMICALLIEWLTTITGVIKIICPVALDTGLLWFDLMICHIWTSLFVYRLLRLVSIQITMLISMERCLRCYYPQLDPRKYPKTVSLMFFCSFVYTLTMSLPPVQTVSWNSITHCRYKNTSSLDNDLPLYQFETVSLVLSNILPMIVINMSYGLILFRSRLPHRFQRNFFHRQQQQQHQPQQHALENNLVTRINIWSYTIGLEYTIIGAFEVVIFFFRQLETTALVIVIIEIARSVFNYLRVILLMILLKEIRQLFRHTLVSMFRVCSKPAY